MDKSESVMNERSVLAQTIREDEMLVRVHHINGDISSRGWKKTMGTAKALIYTMGRIDDSKEVSHVEVILGTQPIKGNEDE